MEKANTARVVGMVIGIVILILAVLLRRLAR
jgi:hypothetical protein